jgi:hypothetical protein
MLLTAFCGGLAAPLLLHRFRRSGWWVLAATGAVLLPFAVGISTAGSSTLRSETSPHDFWVLCAIFVAIAWILGLACGALATGWWALLTTDDIEPGAP